MAKRYDVVVLGVGNAGMGAAGVDRRKQPIHHGSASP